MAAVTCCVRDDPQHGTNDMMGAGAEKMQLQPGQEGTRKHRQPGWPAGSFPKPDYRNELAASSDTRLII
jgi:hypothetical protein